MASQTASFPMCYGREFARHETVTERIGLHVHFCDPHSPWQRGGIENVNGRLRRDLPRNTSLACYTEATTIEAFAANLGVALEM